MKSIFNKAIKIKLIVLSLLLGIITSWLIKDRFAFYLLRISFFNRILVIQIAILAFLVVFTSVLLFLLFSLVTSFYTRNEKLQGWMRIMNQKGLEIIAIKGSAIIAIAMALIASWIAVKYAEQPLLEAHAFRQTQTALTSYWMIREGWQLAYQTPVAGYPWSIPFEFPLFQSLVALIAWLGNFQLDPIGRLVSFSFLIACAWPAFKITQRLNLPSETAWVFCALLWSSPIYLFWGRTFMIETAATFFAFAAIPYAIDICNPFPRWRSALLCTFWGTLGMLQKITTAAPVIMVMAIICLIFHIKTFGLKAPSWRKIACVTLAFITPVVIGFLWTNYTDLIKEKNLLGMSLTSTALTEWNFGSVQQRLDLNVLKEIFWRRALANNAAGIFGIPLLAVSLLREKGRVKMIIIACICLFVLPIFIFTNLHFIHDYYQVSCTIFLIGSLAVATAPLSHRLIGGYAITPAITLILVISNLFSFSTGYANNILMSINLSKSETLAVSDVIRRYTPENSGIVVFDKDWSSEVAYYSDRKSFTVPDWFKEYDSVFNDPAAYLGGEELGAVVYCMSGNRNSLQQFLDSPDVRLQPSFFKVDNCYIWMPKYE
jgi:hypothetical protein